MTTVEELCADNRKLVDENLKLRKENKELRDNYEQYKAVAEPEIAALKNEIVNLKGVIESLSEQRDGLEKEKCELLGIIQGKDKAIADLKKKLAEAENLLRKVIRVTWGEGWNYSLDWKVKAEEFLKEC